MIISASRRTDIPAFYSDWFLNRVKEGYLYVRNPMNRKQVSKISLRPDVIDCIVFWTKNALPLIQHLPELDSRKYCYYFQFTVNAYKTDIEPNVPLKSELLETFIRLSDIIGPERVIWRYDPILLSESYTLDHHFEYFEKFARKLEKHTKKCVISFVDMYKKSGRNLKDVCETEVPSADKLTLAKRFKEITSSCGIALETCAEDEDFGQLGIRHGRCIDDTLIAQLLGRKLKVDKDKFQRLACGCVSSIEIGSYSTCEHGCKYCYATESETKVKNNVALHNPLSPLLYGEVEDDVKITERDMKKLSCEFQNSFTFLQQ